MIAKTKKRSLDAISDAVVYVEGKEVSLVEGKDAAERLFLQNMPFATTKEEIISEMEVVAGKSDRVKKPIYHLIVSWDPKDMSDEQKKLMAEGGVDWKELAPEKVTNEEMVVVAKRLLKNLGLEEHQAMVTRHRDRDHPHMHILVNRIRLGANTAWKGSNDYRTIQRTLRALEREFGWRETPGRHAILPGQNIPPRTSKAEYWDRKGKGLPPKPGQPAPDKFVLSLTEHGQELTLPSHLPQTDKQLWGCWKRAVEGDADCQWQMGEMYRVGAGVEQDLGVAMGWYELAREQEHPGATAACSKLERRGIDAAKLPKKSAWGKGVDSDWRGRVGRDRRDQQEGLEDRGLEQRLQR